MPSGKKHPGHFGRRFAVVLVLTIPLALYGYLLQLVYENNAKHGASFKNAGLSFASMLFTAVMYDCIKKVALLDDRHLIVMSKHFGWLFAGVAIMLFGCVLTTHIQSNYSPIYSSICYFLTLIFSIPLIVRSLTRAIDTGVRAP